MKKTWKRELLSLSLIAVGILAVRSSVAAPYHVPTGSMEPTILPGDRFISNQMQYGLRVPFTSHFVTRMDDPAHGDIVVFPSPENDITLVKRVVAISGDKIEGRGGQLLINDQPVKLEYVGRENGFDRFREKLGEIEHWVQFSRWHGSRSFGPLIVPEGHFFAMGDNRDNSADSRAFGPVPVSSIKGKALALFISIGDEFPYVRPGRTGLSLSGL